MSCPFHSEDDGSDDTEPAGDDRGIDRRELVKSALAIGGAGAVSTLGSLAGIVPTARAADHEGRIDAATRLNRQHAWDAFEATVPTGNTAQPAHSLFLLLDYDAPSDEPPSDADRRQMEAALREIERHFAWGREGVLFTVAYSSVYFDRFDEDPPAGARPTPPEQVVDYTDDITPYDPAADDHEVALLLSSDNPANLLAVETALWGGEADGVRFDATFEGLFEQPEVWPHRRIGFAGPGLPTERYEAQFDIDIPDGSPLSMGFVAGFDASIPEEEAVTLTRGQRFPGPGIDAGDVPDLPYVGAVGERDPGVFAQGTLKHLSYLEIDLDEWYDSPRAQRRHQIYSPYHQRSETTTDESTPGSGLTSGERGDGPGTDDLVARDPDGADDSIVYADRTGDTATEGTALTDGDPTTGHSQKAARARYDLDGDGELEQPCLRRDWDGVRPAENGYQKAAGYHFNVPMRFNEGIFTLLDANYSPGFTSLDGRIDHESVEPDAPAGLDGDRNGIVPFMDATRRGNFLVPPVRLRALPHPRAAEATVQDVRRDGDAYVVALGDVGDLDDETVRLGAPTAVNQAGGTEPTFAIDVGGRAAFRFPADAVEAEDELKLYAERAGSRRPVVATFPVPATN